MNKTNQKVINLLKELKDGCDTPVYLLIRKYGLNPYTLNALINIDLLEKSINGHGYDFIIDNFILVDSYSSTADIEKESEHLTSEEIEANGIIVVTFEDLAKNVIEETYDIIKTKRLERLGREKLNKLEEKLDKVITQNRYKNPRYNAHQNSAKNKKNRPNKKDVNDYPTPKEFVDIILNGVVERKIFGDVKMEDGIDLCCSEENKKFEKGLTLNGPTGFNERDVFFNNELKSVCDSLEHNWSKLATFGWIASPYKKKEDDTKKYEHGIQGSFAKKAFEESNKGMKIIALFQDSSVNSNWFQEYIYTNKNCQVIFMEGRLTYPEMYYTSPDYGNALVFFGIDSNSIQGNDFEYFRLAIKEYDKITSNKKKILRKQKRELKLIEN